MVKEMGRRNRVIGGGMEGSVLLRNKTRLSSYYGRTFTQKRETVFNALLKRVSIFTLAVDRGTI